MEDGKWEESDREDGNGGKVGGGMDRGGEGGGDAAI